MTDRPYARALRWSKTTILLCAFCLSAFGGRAVAQGVYAHEDASLSGISIYAGEFEGEQVSVVLGDFTLEVGGRVVSGRSAVIWVKETFIRRSAQRTITAYVEGDAIFVESDGTVLSDQYMLVTLRHQGRLSARGNLVASLPEDTSLLERASTARKTGKLQGLVRKPPPKIIVAKKPPPERKPPEPPKREPKQPSKPKGPQLPVTFYAQKVTSRFIGEGKDRRRVTIAKGDVYLSQGNPDSDLFLELRCDSAVVFTVESAAGDGSSASLVEETGMGAMPLGSGDEKIAGVYLEGDVVIQRGERMLRGPSAFYDFTLDRAIVVGGVFRTIQEQRNIPVFVRSKEARQLAKGEYWFLDAKVTTSDFYSPTYHVAAKRAYIKDIAPYDEKGKRLGPQEWRSKLWHSTLNVRGLPILYWPYTREEFEHGHTSLRKVQVGDQGNNFGYGIDTQWELFRLLGVTKPKGFKGRFEWSYYERGWLAGANLRFIRPETSGYTMVYGLIDNRRRDDFGDARSSINVPNYRGRFTHRQKNFLPKDWLVQSEISWYSDTTYPEAFFASEFHAGKPQETLLYAKKHMDNRVFTSLLQYRLNRFDTQTESAPDLEFYAIGEGLFDDRATLFSETRAGLKRWRPAKASKGVGRTDSRMFTRLDAREEISFPSHFGPFNVTPYAVVRGTYWDDSPPGGEKSRPYGQVGARANFHIWRVYPNVESRIWDLHRLKHVITPEAVAFASDTGGVSPSDLFVIEPDIEQHLNRQSGYSAGFRQRLLTKRGKPGRREVVDWMRLDVMAGRFRETSSRPADGRLFMHRPEYNLARNYVNADYLWNISDATTILSDCNYDTHTGKVGRNSVSLNVTRNPRLSYFGGVRYLRPVDSSVATAGLSYKLTEKYSMTFFEQYDLDYSSGENLSSNLVLTRKLERWYMSFTVVFDQGGESDDIGFFLTLWPEGVPEVKFGQGAKGFFGGQTSDLN